MNPLLRRTPLVGLLLLLGGSPALADVPRSCVHPRAHPTLCALETRLQHADVLPRARVLELERQRRELLEVAPRQDRLRNHLLRHAVEELRALPKQPDS